MDPVVHGRRRVEKSPSHGKPVPAAATRPLGGLRRLGKRRAVAGLVFRAERAILARRLRVRPASCRPSRLPVRAAPAYWGRTGLLGSQGRTGVARAYWGSVRGEPVPVSRRGWRAEGPEARERESSSEPRPDAEANARRNGTGSPRASQAVASTRRTQRDNATKRSVPAAIGAGFSRRAGHPGPAAYGYSRRPAGLVFRAERAIVARRLRVQPASCRASRLRRNRPTPVRAAPAYWGRTGLLGPHRATGAAPGVLGSQGRTGVARAYWGRKGVLGSQGRTGVR
jgi:hypothetical protein